MSQLNQRNKIKCNLCNVTSTTLSDLSTHKWKVHLDFMTSVPLVSLPSHNPFHSQSTDTTPSPSAASSPSSTSNTVDSRDEVEQGEKKEEGTMLSAYLDSLMDFDAFIENLTVERENTTRNSRGESSRRRGRGKKGRRVSPY